MGGTYTSENVVMLAVSQYADAHRELWNKSKLKMRLATGGV